MPRVMTEVGLGELRPIEVWPTLIDFERYPSIMTDVISVTVQERMRDGMITSWEVLLNGSRFTWTERDVFSAPHLITFEQIDGDLEVWRGSWDLQVERGELVARLTVDFDIGIPSLSEILDPIGERAIRANSRQMLDAIRDHARKVVTT